MLHPDRFPQFNVSLRTQHCDAHTCRTCAKIRNYNSQPKVGPQLSWTRSAEVPHLEKIVLVLRTRPGWWCPCIKESNGIGSREHLVILLRQLGRAQTLYEQAVIKECCEGCGQNRKCIRALKTVPNTGVQPLTATRQGAFRMSAPQRLWKM